jgi:hypothetical protein
LHNKTILIRLERNDERESKRNNIIVYKQII